jgi:phosphatidate cytidylyltransferase
MVREMFTLARKAAAELRLPGFRAQQWYFFFVAAFYVHLRFIKRNLLVEASATRTAAAAFAGLLRRHALISYSLYMAGA